MEDSVSKNYIKGFNAAYLIADHKPKLMDSLLKSEIKSDFMEGMYDGKQIFDKEKVKKLANKKSRLEELNKIQFRKNKKRGRSI